MENILENVRTVLRTTPPRWQELTRSIAPELLQRRPLENEWSAQEVLQHLIDVEKGVFTARIQAFLSGAEGFPNFDPAQHGSKMSADASPQDMAAEFERLRAASFKVLDTVTPGDLSRTAIHGELGRVSLSELLHEWAGHDLMHLVQAEQAIMQPFIAGCGPWLSYFTKHVAAK